MTTPSLGIRTAKVIYLKKSTDGSALSKRDSVLSFLFLVFCLDQICVICEICVTKIFVRFVVKKISEICVTKIFVRFVKFVVGIVFSV